MSQTVSKTLVSVDPDYMPMLVRFVDADGNEFASRRVMHKSMCEEYLKQFNRPTRTDGARAEARPLAVSESDLNGEF